MTTVRRWIVIDTAGDEEHVLLTDGSWRPAHLGEAPLPAIRLFATRTLARAERATWVGARRQHFRVRRVDA